MASSGSRRNNDPERAHRVRSDAARNRAAHRYTRWGLMPPPSLLRLETEEYDRARGRLFSGSTSFEASNSRSSSSLPPVKRELEELPSVKMEPEAEAVPERRAGAVVGPEDFLPPAEADSLLPVLLARSAPEVEEDQQRRRREEEIDTVLYEQGVASAIAFGHKVEEWRREATAQKRIYIELSSDEDDEDDD
ncbi:putative atp-dependent helicase [Hordeum vulgare]|nr:putative atp-dependent helicase [Hordeum vulgare]